MSQKIRTKFCGITRSEDAIQAARLGVDAIGLVFYGNSPRAVTVAQAQAIVDVLPPFVTKVGLFVNAEKAYIEHVLTQVPIDVLQFHGDEPAPACNLYRLPFIKALAMQADIDLAAVAERYRHASALLIDSEAEGLRGGTGKVFDWSLIKEHVSLPLILAGGLSPANVMAAIKTVQPYAVDVSSGIESAKGLKSVDKMQAFMKSVRQAYDN